MFLAKLIYCSRAVDDGQRLDIERLLDGARRFNEQKDVTGLLLFKDGFFLQALEGSSLALGEVFTRIAGNDIHGEIMIHEYSTISERVFSEWRMGYMGETSITRPLILRCSGSDRFNPYAMDPPGASALLREMANLLYQSSSAA